MYQEYWKLKEKPFQNTPDPRFLYYSTQHEEALLKLVYAVKERLGAAVLTGVFGCGKTLLGQALLQELSEDKYKIAFIANPQMDYVELLRSIVRHLKSIELPVKKTELSADYLLEVLDKILTDNMRDGHETVVVIDEAHIIKDEKMFEEIRLLLNFQRQDRFLLTLLLFGQPELRQMIEDNKQLEQRVGIKCHLDSLNETDTKNYIIHRLKVVGGSEAIFTDEAMKLIFEHTGGIPRRINRICDLSLLAGFGKKVDQINEEIVSVELENLGG